MTAEDALSRDASHSAAPPLVVRAQGSARTLPAGTAYWIGRDPAADIVIDEPLVSWRHAIVKITDGRWLLQDANSTNGTFAAGQRVRRVEITDSCQIRLGHPDAGPVVFCSITDSPDSGTSAEPSATAIWSAQRTAGERFPSAVLPLPAKVLRIGRSAGNDIVVADLGVSRRHAELRSSPGGEYEIADLGSHNGTFLNGQRITTATVSEADVIGIGPATFRLVGDELQEFVDGGDISLDARGLTVTLPNGKVLLDDVSFPLGERCLLGVIGPSGAGKSTLLGALTGMRPATTGSVLYDGRDLYANYAELRHRIGLVPQENILHTHLSAHRALGYAAELRFPSDTSPAERTRRIGEVLGELSLTGHADTRTSSLSGGQQKRVNVALELLTKPSLLFLDEPTSGLDPGLDMSVMEMMSGLARDGRTVIVVTHSVANLNVCDRLLVLVPGGKVAYFGSPADGLRHFGRPGWAQVFRAFEAEPDRDWAGEYRRSTYFARYMTAPSAAEHPSAAVVRAAPPPPKSQNRLAQLSTLVRRYLAVIASDRNYVGVIALLPIILGGLIRAIPDPGGLTGTSNGNAIQVLLILVMGACLIGVANAVRELVKERPIYYRERAAGLSPGAYLASKLAVLGLISAVQAVVLVLIGLAGRPLPRHGAFLTAAPLAELMLGIAVLAVASMTAGLLISAVVNSSDKTMPLLVVTVLAEVVLSGGVFRLNGTAGLEQISWLSSSRWGFGAVASTSNLNQVTPPPPGNTPDPLWQRSPHIWLLDMAMQLALTAVLAGLAWWRLRQASPGRRR
jgi:ABC-type multidrug transport system ATPase subunit/pSer/pThr/pTyr-binding forkhead associated (FHA) protein